MKTFEQVMLAADAENRTIGLDLFHSFIDEKEKGRNREILRNRSNRYLGQITQLAGKGDWTNVAKIIGRATMMGFALGYCAKKGKKS